MTLICAGNRRSEFNSIEQTQGLEWKSDAISTSTFKGVLLKDLKPLISEQSEVEKHVWFIGADGAEDAPYDASIPTSKAFSEDGDVLLAYEMNGMQIPRDHGGPLRVIG